MTIKPVSLSGSIKEEENIIVTPFQEKQLVGQICLNELLKANVSSEEKLSGQIVSTDILQASLYETIQLNGSILVPKTINEGDCDIYEGTYEITPKTNEQKVKTKNRILLDDLTVLAIPFYKVDNSSDGQTIIIGD